MTILLRLSGFLTIYCGVIWIFLKHLADKNSVYLPLYKVLHCGNATLLNLPS